MSPLWGHATGIIILLMMGVFIGIWIWAWRPRHRVDFGLLARLPMADHPLQDEIASDAQPAFASESEFESESDITVLTRAHKSHIRGNSDE